MSREEDFEVGLKIWTWLCESGFQSQHNNAAMVFTMAHLALLTHSRYS